MTDLPKPPRPSPELEAFVDRLNEAAAAVPESAPIVGVFVVMHVPSGLTALLGTEPFNADLASSLLQMALTQIDQQRKAH